MCSIRRDDGFDARVAQGGAKGGAAESARGDRIATHRQRRRMQPAQAVTLRIRCVGHPGATALVGLADDRELADPRDGAMKDRINAAVKYREPFRPFAPAILAERQTEYFDIRHPLPTPYMEKALPVLAEMQTRIPAVVHRDGTARLQTVTHAEAPHLHAVLVALEQRTGVPVVLNTSFNLNGEPIVDSPTDAIRTYFSSGLDALAIGPFLLAKEQLT